VNDEASPTPPLERRALYAALAIVALAVLLRVAYVLGTRESVYFDAPIMDALYHLEWARALAAGDSFQDGPFFRAPLYPWFLSTLLRFFGEGLLVPRLVQAALGGLTTWLTFLVGRRAFDARTGLVAAALVATNWVLIYFDGELLIPTLGIPLNLIALLLTQRLAEAPTTRNAGAAGMVWGLAAIARPNALLFLPLVFAWLLWRARPQWLSGLWRGLALAGGTLVPILPLTFYNATVGGDAVLISSQAGVNLWIGNNPQSDGSTAVVPGTRPGWWEGYDDAIALAEQAEGRELLPSEVSQHYSQKAWAWMTAEPGAALTHFGWKLRLFFLDWELGNNADVNFFAHHDTPWMRALPPSFALLGPLGLVGLVIALRRRRASALAVVGFTLVYSGSVVLFFVCSRYRAPVLPLLAVFAAATLVESFTRARARRWGAVLALLVPAALLVVPTRAFPERLDATQSMGYWALGIHELGAGRPREAVPHFEQALLENPRNLYALRDLGAAHQAAGDLREATAAYRAALELKPNELPIVSSLVDLLIARRELDEAESVARRGLAANPLFPTGYDALARVHIARQEYEPAQAILRRGLERDADDYFCNLRLGGLLLLAGDPCAALEPLARAARSPSAPSEGHLRQAADALRQARADCP